MVVKLDIDWNKASGSAIKHGTLAGGKIKYAFQVFLNLFSLKVAWYRLFIIYSTIQLTLEKYVGRKLAIEMLSFSIQVPIDLWLRKTWRLPVELPLTFPGMFESLFPENRMILVIDY